MLREIRQRRDVVFGEGGGRQPHCDIYEPTSGANGCAVLMLHGGSWKRGDKGVMEPQAISGPPGLRVNGFGISLAA